LGCGNANLDEAIFTFSLLAGAQLRREGWTGYGTTRQGGGQLVQLGS
jgi:hypothetical protein